MLPNGTRDWAYSPTISVSSFGKGVTLSNSYTIFDNLGRGCDALSASKYRCLSIMLALARKDNVHATGSAVVFRLSQCLSRFAFKNRSLSDNTLVLASQIPISRITIRSTICSSESCTFFFGSELPLALDSAGERVPTWAVF